jgi:flagellar motor component MotA
MNLMAMIGLVFGIAVFLVSVLIALGNIATFIDWPSPLIVFGGSIAAVMMATNSSDLRAVLVVLIKQGHPAKYIEEKLNAYLLPGERGKKAA